MEELYPYNIILKMLKIIKIWKNYTLKIIPSILNFT